MKRIYMDHAATSPLRPEVLEAMKPYLSDAFGNPSSLHSYGREARVALDTARHAIASCLNCDPRELVFTSGGTESDNTALFGAAWQRWSAGGSASRGHIITTSVEHHAVLHACQRLEELGFDVTYLPVDEHGRISLEQFEAAIRDDTFLVSVIYGNNEVGTLQPIAELGLIARERGLLMHVDAVQALGVLDLDLSRLPVDFMSFSAHKINGPKGVGLLYCRSSVKWTPLLYGGSQERKFRAGTENVAGIAGFAEAMKLVKRESVDKRNKLWELRQLFLGTLENDLSAAGLKFIVNGHPTEVLPHIINVSFPGLSTDTLLMNLDLSGIAASSGSACTAGSLEPSHVLIAMGLPDECLRSAVRFSLGYGLTQEDVREAAARVAKVVTQLKERIRQVR